MSNQGLETGGVMTPELMMAGIADLKPPIGYNPHHQFVWFRILNANQVEAYFPTIDLLTEQRLRHLEVSSRSSAGLGFGEAALILVNHGIGPEPAKLHHKTRQWQQKKLDSAPVMLASLIRRSPELRDYKEVIDAYGDSKSSGTFGPEQKAAAALGFAHLARLAILAR